MSNTHEWRIRMKTTIIYWTSSGNTEKMARLIEQGLNASGLEIETSVKSVGTSTVADIKESDLVLLGCPAMGMEEIDTLKMEPFIQRNKKAFIDKPVALFGSYGWGEGEWMENWEAMMDGLGAKMPTKSLIINEMPEGTTEIACVDFGIKISQLHV